MVERHPRKGNSAAGSSVWWGLGALVLLVTSCVVYTPELLHEETVSLGRPNGAASDSPAAPAPWRLQSRSDLRSSRHLLAAPNPLRSKPHYAPMPGDAAADSGTSARGLDAGETVADSDADAGGAEFTEPSATRPDR